MAITYMHENEVTTRLGHDLRPPVQVPDFLSGIHYRSINQDQRLAEID